MSRFAHIRGPRITLYGRRRKERRDGKRRSARLPERIFYIFTAVLSGWVFGFVSGLFPYLGYASVSNYAGPGFSSPLGSLGFGIKSMFLVEGQTVFFNYRSTSDASEMTFDVRPWASIGYSDDMQRIHGKGQGTVEIPIRKSGFYRLQHSPALARSYGRTAYSVSWGAR